MNQKANNFIIDYIDKDSATICLLIGNDNIINYANVFAGLLTGKELVGVNLNEIFITFKENPSVDKFLKSKEKKILININTSSEIPSTYYFQFYNLDDGILAIGEANNEETNLLKKNFLEINQDLNTLTRELHKKNAELNKLNEQKNKFLGIAAHDLRNPLSIIISYVDYFLNDLGDQLTVKQHKILKMILKSSEFMLNLLNELLDISKIESGKLTLNKKQTNLLLLIKNIIELNQTIASKKNISIQLEVFESIPDVLIDEMKIEQVLNNLISNAIKYSFENKTIKINVLLSGENITIAIIDQGQGIPADEIDKLFKPFETTSVQSTAGEKSTGLGLAIVRNIIIGHQGKIWVESDVGKGSTFYFSIPIFK